MAETKSKSAAPATPADSTAEAPKKRRMGTAAIVAVVMVVEGAAVFAVMKMMGGQAIPATAVELVQPASQPARDDEEIQLVQLRALNVKSGRPVLYGLKVFVRVPGEQAESVRKMIEKRRATIEDAVARLVRSAEPSHLSEDGLETIRRQMQFELGRILADQSVSEILIPECTPFPTGF